jgi:alpha-1,6-mannosyltransferase
MEPRARVSVLDVNNHYSATGGGVRTYHHAKLAYYRERSDVRYALVVPSTRFARRAEGNATIFEVPALPSPAQGYRVLHDRAAIARVVDEFAPDIVEVGSVFALPRFVRHAVAGKHIAVVAFLHSDYPLSYVRPFFGRAGARVAGLAGRAADAHMRRAYERFDAVFAASEHSCERLRSLGLSRVVRVPFGVDSRAFRPDLRERSDDRRVVLFLGRLAAEKGIDLLFEAYPRFRDPSITVRIGGRGPARKRLERFVARYPEVQALDRIDGEAALARTYASADLLLSLGSSETFSLATLEALACGTPVIAPDAGGAGELVRRSGAGRVFPAGDAGALARAIREPLPDEHRDRARAFALGQSWERTFDRLTSAYARVVEAVRSSTIGSLDALEELA